MGTKKIQQILTEPKQLERFLIKEECDLLRECFAGLFNLSGNDATVTDIIKKAMSNPSAYVLKPQREGGGNNIYGENLVSELSRMSEDERAAYILMERIQSPTRDAVLVKKGNTLTCPCICELGIYSVFIGYNGNEPIVNESSGYLLRVKPATSGSS